MSKSETFEDRQAEIPDLIKLIEEVASALRCAESSEDVENFEANLADARDDAVAFLEALAEL